MILDIIFIIIGIITVISTFKILILSFIDGYKNIKDIIYFVFGLLLGVFLIYLSFTDIVNIKVEEKLHENTNIINFENQV